jgi:hypothetical protein
MPATVNVNMRTVVHASSSGMLMCMPDVCQTPAPPSPSPIPIPYPNIAQSSDTASGSTTVKCDGNPIMLESSNFKMSTGDEAGTIGGLMSGVTKGKAEPKMYSFDVKMDGKKVVRLMDIMVSNSMNTPPFPVMQPPCVVVILPDMEQDASPPGMQKLDNPEGEQQKAGG